MVNGIYIKNMYVYLIPYNLYLLKYYNISNFCWVIEEKKTKNKKDTI